MARLGFTSPLDNALDRVTYFALLAQQQDNEGFDYIHQAETATVIVYEAHTTAGETFHSEVHTVRNGRLVTTEVYFG